MDITRGRLSLRNTTYDVELHVSGEDQLHLRLEDPNACQSWAGTFAASCARRSHTPDSRKCMIVLRSPPDVLRPTDLPRPSRLAQNDRKLKGMPLRHKN